MLMQVDTNLTQVAEPEILTPQIPLDMIWCQLLPPLFLKTHFHSILIYQQTIFQKVTPLF
jgi:hypothetical protein